MKKRGAVDVARPQGSKVDLSMMRTTTGRQLVQVAQAPKGSSKKAEIQMEGGQSIDVDLGGGVVSEGGRVIKPGEALDNLLEELEWVLLESDISSQASSAIIDSLRNALVGARLRRVLNSPKCWRPPSSVPFMHCSKRGIGTLTPRWTVSLKLATFPL